MPEIGIIGGSGVYSLEDIEDPQKQKIDTPYGKSPEIITGIVKNRELAFMPRHGKKHTEPPHKINFKANIQALEKLGVERIIATTAVGSLNSEIAPGEFVIIDQFLDFTKNRPRTFYDGSDGEVVHVDMTNPYCSELRKTLIDTAENLEIPVNSSGTYACTEGPRYETSAEIQMLNELGGDLVGMTNVPECVLARELEICYSTVSVVTNYGAGISEEKLTHTEVAEIMEKNIKRVKELIFSTIPNIPSEKSCGCGEALDGAQVEP